MRGLSVAIACVTTLATALGAQMMPGVTHFQNGEDSAWTTPFNAVDSNDSGVWIELDSRIAKQIADGDIDLLDQYLDPINGVQRETLLRDYPTAHNYDVINGLDNNSSTSVPAGASVNDLTTTAARIEKNPHGCHLLPYGTKGISGGVMRMHKRSDSGSSRYGIIGWKPYTRCVTTPSAITNQNLFYRTTIGGLWYPEAKGTQGTAWNTKTYQQKNITWYCKNAKREDWMGRTISTVTAKNGKVYVAQQNTQKLTTTCGI